MKTKTLTHAEAKRLVQILQVEKKTDMESDGFQALIEAADSEQNRTALLINGKCR